MRLRNLFFGLALLCLVSGPATAWADKEEASRQFAAGKTLLAKGDLTAALEAFTAAAKTDPENQEYFQETALLRRVLNIREQLATEQDAAAWQQMAHALCGYYRSRDVWGEATSLAGKLHAKEASGESAALLAEAQLALNQNDQAAALLADLPEDKATVEARVLRGLALARLGQLDESRAVAAGLEMPKDCSGIVCYHAARLHALLGESDQAVKLLVCAFECTPPNQLVALKDQAKACSDLGTLRSGDAFVKALQTESKVKGGCGGCTKKCTEDKSTCADKDKKDAGCKEYEKPSKDSACQHDKQ